MSEPVAQSRPARSSRLKRQLQTILTVALVAFAAWYLWQQWHDASAAHVRFSVDARWLAVATVLVLATYILLVETWRRVLGRYGSAISFRDAARIWFISNLGKYVPGKVWQVTTMTTMLSELHVPIATAAGASVVITIANIIAGFALILAIGTQSLRTMGTRYQSAVVVATSILFAALLVAPFMMRMLSALASRVFGRSITIVMPVAVVWMSLAGCALAWLLYGSAFQLLVLALLGAAPAPWVNYVAAYTLSYLVGYLAIVVPGGLGIREVTLAALLVALRITTPAEATIITVASRLWLTVLEILPGVLFLFVRPANDTAAHLSS